jgi:plasmid maintenance system antidote protein VapI
VTIDTALRLARFFETTPEFRMTMQTGYDLKQQTGQTSRKCRHTGPWRRLNAASPAVI